MVVAEEALTHPIVEPLVLVLLDLAEVGKRSVTLHKPDKRVADLGSSHDP